MPNINSGSISRNIYDSISPISNNISGLLLTIVEQNLFYVEQMTGNTIGTTVIAEQYQLPITNLATANVLKLMAVQEGGVKSASIGDLSIENGNLSSMATQYQELGQKQLMQLTKGLKFAKSRG